MNESECDYRDEPIDEVNEPLSEEVAILMDDAEEAADRAFDADGGPEDRQAHLFDAAQGYLRAAGEDLQLDLREVVKRLLLHIGFSTEATDETDTDV